MKMNNLKCSPANILRFYILFIFGLKNCSFEGHSVSKRFVLLAPRTTVLQLTYGVAIPIVFRPGRQIVIDNCYQTNFDLPYNLSNFQVATYYARTAMDSLDISRETLYVYIMNTLDNLGLDGEQCLLRAICDVAHAPFQIKEKNSILEKIAQFIFTPSKYYNFEKNLQEERGINNMTFGENLLLAQNVGHQKKDCEESYPKCDLSIIDLISRKYHFSD